MARLSHCVLDTGDFIFGDPPSPQGIGYAFDESHIGAATAKAARPAQAPPASRIARGGNTPHHRSGDSA